MAEKYYIDLSTINTFAACADLITEIGNNEEIAPVLAYTNPVNVQYWLDFNKVETNEQFILTVGNTEVNAFGTVKKAPVAPVAIDGTVMVPFEFFAKTLGASYSWSEETATATVTYGARDIVVTIGSATATILGEPVAMGAAAYVDADTNTVMIPLTFAAESMCATVVTTDESAGTYTVEFNDYNDMSVLVSSYGATATLQNRTPMTSAFGNEAFTKHMLLMKRCEENGWFAEDPATTEFGVAIIDGDYSDVAQYEDKYEIKVLSYPALTEETVYESMFAVTSYTANLDRAMEIITLINTDVEAKNILQYGVEGIHYEFDDNDNFVIISEDYSMNNLYTGNKFLAYTTADVPADIWENAMSSNLDSRVSPYYGLSSSWETVDAGFFTTLRALSNDYFDRMADCETEAELSEFFTSSKKALDINMLFASALSTADDSNSPYAVYTRWGTSNKYWTVE